MKDKLLYNGKVRERGAETPDFNSTRTATQLLLPPHTGYYSITLTHDPVELRHRNKPLLNYITKPGNTSACAQMLYYQNSYPISRCMLGLLPINTVSSPGVGLQCSFLERYKQHSRCMYDERFQTEHCTTTLSPLRFNVYLLLPIHVVFYCSLRLAPGCPASTLVSSTGQVQKRTSRAVIALIFTIHDTEFRARP